MPVAFGAAGATIFRGAAFGGAARGAVGEGRKLAGFAMSPVSGFSMLGIGGIFGSGSADPGAAAGATEFGATT